LCLVMYVMCLVMYVMSLLVFACTWLLLCSLSETEPHALAPAAGGNSMWRLDSAPSASEQGWLGGGGGVGGLKPRALAPVDHITLDPCDPSRMALVLQVCSSTRVKQCLSYGLFVWQAWLAGRNTVPQLGDTALQLLMPSNL
jgi:hypothetical protein